MEPKDYWALGTRDAIAAIFASIRVMGVETTLKRAAEQLVASDPEHPNPHAVWFLEKKETEVAAS